jgi:DNA-binding response OmpR family regulator
VDDDPSVLRSLRDIFGTRDFVVSTASSATEAIALLSRNSFDLVVTDMRMEKSTSGFEVVRAARAQRSKAVVAILSAFPIAGKDWRNAGADAMFSKGGGVFRMINELEKILESRHPGH